MKKLPIIAFLLLLNLKSLKAQTINIVLLHQLVNNNKTEHKTQKKVKENQLITSINESNNKNSTKELKEKYKKLQDRFYKIKGFVNIAFSYGTKAKNSAQKISNYQTQIFNQVKENPEFLPFVLETEKNLLLQSKNLITYLTGLFASTIDIYGMKESDRALLLQYVIDELAEIETTCYQLSNQLNYNIIKNKNNAFKYAVEKDIKLMKDIIDKYKKLNL